MNDIDLLNLNSTQGFKILGAVARDYTGISVSKAGDINGDGFNDVIIGASYASPIGRTNAGMAYVIYGNSSGLTDIDLASLRSAQGFRILGAVSGDDTGISVSGVGDINGDGFNDVIVGGDSAFPSGRRFAGIAYVIYGNSSGFTDIDLLNFTTAQGFRIIGAVSHDNAGISVSEAGDINGDGISDVIIGAQGASRSGRTAAGATYVIYGNSTGLTDIDLLSITTEQGFRILGAVSGDFTGVSVSEAGDINGDGFNDVIVGADLASPIGRTNAGMAYVIYGNSTGLTDIDLASLTSAQGFRILGAGNIIGLTDIDLLNFTVAQGLKTFSAVAHNYAGISVSEAGDINGDGFDDVIVGADHTSPNGRRNAGTAYVIYGNNTGLTDIDLLNFTTAQGFRILGAEAGDCTGISVSTAGDVNGDGVVDVIIGAYNASPSGRAQAGTAYVIYGKNGGLPDIDLAVLTLAQGFKILGAAANDYTGISVNAAGDINGDGFNDVIVGADYASPSGRAYAGAAYVIYGNNASSTTNSPTFSPITMIPTYTPTSFPTMLPTSMSIEGDPVPYNIVIGTNVEQED